jgi:diguanylate cyclase (GGDEF)-like protein
MSLLLPGNPAPLVLVAAHDAGWRNAIREVLAADGLRVIEAEDGRQALERTLELRPDLLVLDVLLPQLDGCQVCAELRARPACADLPILVLTELDDADALEGAFHAGVTDFATRPVVPTLLAHRVRYMLRAKRALDELRANQATLARAQRMARLGSWEFEVATGTVRLSPEGAHLLGLSAGPACCTLDQLLVHVPEEDAARLISLVAASVRTGRAFRADHGVVLEGEARHLHTQAAPLRDEHGRVIGLTGTTQDISERIEGEARMRALAFYDTLTGLPNRVLFTDLLRAALARAQRLDRHVAVMFLDLDAFKSINDTLGHRAGDRVLEQVALRLRDVTREYDAVARSAAEGTGLTLGRLGGDEFLLAITDLGHADDAATVASRILDAFRAPIHTQEGEIRATVSIGVSVFPEDGGDVDELLKNADTALYHAKAVGRNTFEFYSPQLSEAALHRMMLEGRLRDAVERNEFLLFYQPQVDTRTRRVVGVEALLRWQHPGLGIVGPAHFVATLEQTRLIHALGPWIVRTAAAQLKAWHDQGLDGLNMAINLSGEQLRQPEIAETLHRAAEETGVDRRFIEFEITESVLIEAGSQGVTAVKQLKAKGYRIAMDDFGTGYSSLSYLTHLPVDCLKIDRSFTEDILTNVTHAAVVETIVDLAGKLNIEPLVEGVERPEQCQKLQQLGCSLMQGYLFGKPMAAPDLLKHLEAGPLCLTAAGAAAGSA